MSDRSALAPSLPRETPSPNPARSLAARRSRRRSEVLRGNVRALSHGVFAVVANMPDVSTEVELVYAARPGLDPIADRRLVESFALAAVQHRRAIEAMATDGLTEMLTAYEARLAPLVERLERTLHDREQTRLADRGGPDPLDKYKESR